LICPALPTQEHAGERLQAGTVGSDHVPQKLVFEYKMGDTEKKLTVVTMNVLGGFEDGAYTLTEKVPAFGKIVDNEEWQEKRWQLHANCIEKLITSPEPPDLIAIQENNSGLQKTISTKLLSSSYEWDSQGRHNGMLFNKDQYQSDDNKFKFSPNELGANITTLKKGEDTIILYNIHADFGAPFKVKENAIREILERKLKMNLLEVLRDEKLKQSVSAGTNHKIEAVVKNSKLARQEIWRALKEKLPHDDFEKLYKLFKTKQKNHAKDIFIFNLSIN
jgi:hypothetical protein